MTPQEPLYQHMTNRGYDFYEASSAFQKAIRRCDEEMAMFFAVEFYNSGYDEYLWKRMRIIMSEDIGLAEPSLPATIAALYDTYTEMKKKKDIKHKPERLFLAHAVLLLVRAKKSRYVDWALIAHWEGHDSVEMAIPDYAFDVHNRRGRMMGRGMEHFWSEGSHIENQADVLGEAEMKERARKARKEGRS